MGRLTEQIGGDDAQVLLAVAADTPLTLENSGEGVTIPYHTGAAAFYKENGITVETEG